MKTPPGPIGYSELIKKSVAAGLYGDLRRIGTFAAGLIREHNYECYYPGQSNINVPADFENLRDFLAFTGDKNIEPL